MDDAEFQALQQQLCRNELERLENSFATGGDAGAVLHAIFLCFQHADVIPEWAQNAFRRAYVKGLHGAMQTRSWNEVFGRPPRTKAQMQRFMRDLIAPKEIWCAVAEAKDRGEPIDNALFEKVGVKFRLDQKALRTLVQADREAVISGGEFNKIIAVTLDRHPNR
jgi:hypothetical protein